MLEISDGYRSAVVGDVRRMLIKAILDLVDPDIVYGIVDSSGAAAWSKPEQLYDREMDSMSRYATLETGRWLLDGSFRILPDDPAQITGAWRSPAERTTQRTFGFSMQSKTDSAAVANDLPVCRDHMPILKREPSRTHRC